MYELSLGELEAISCEPTISYPGLAVTKKPGMSRARETALSSLLRFWGRETSK